MVIPLLVIITALFVVPIELPYSIQVPGRVVPMKEWVLGRSQNGGLVSTLYDHVRGTVESSGITEVERGDYVTVRLHPTVVDGAPVTVGDTVGVIYSTLVEREWVRLHGALETEMALLRLNSTGEKESVIEEARLGLVYAQEQAEQQRKEVARLRGLPEKGFIPIADMERAETTLKLYETQVDRAKAQLQTVQTGAREEQIDAVRTRITALQEEIAVLGKWLRTSTLIAPISGRLACFLSGDTLAVVQDTTGYAVISPVKWKDRPFVGLKQHVEVQTDGPGDQLTGTLERMGHTVHMVNGEQVFGVVSTIREDQIDLIPGLIVYCSISCAPVSPFEYIWRSLTR